MNPGQTSGVIPGLNGAYVVSVKNISRPESSSLDAETAERIKSELEQQLTQKYMSIWLDELKEEADIVDNRARLLQ